MFHLGLEQTILAYVVGLFCPHLLGLFLLGVAKAIHVEPSCVCLALKPLFCLSIIISELLKSKVLRVFKLTGKITTLSCGYNLLLRHALYLY